MDDVLQKTTTLMGDNATDTATQDASGFEDTFRSDTAVVSAVVHKRVNCSLNQETAATKSGPWNVAATVDSTGVVYLQAQPGAANKLERYLRWRVAATVANWEICFRLGMVLKD